jgi:hypothetical protein
VAVAHRNAARRALARNLIHAQRAVLGARHKARAAAANRERQRQVGVAGEHRARLRRRSMRRTKLLLHAMATLIAARKHAVDDRVVVADQHALAPHRAARADGKARKRQIRRGGKQRGAVARRRERS